MLRTVELVALLLIAAAIATLVWLGHTNDRVDRLEREHDELHAELEQVRREARISRQLICKAADQFGYDGPPVRC